MGRCCTPTVATALRTVTPLRRSALLSRSRPAESSLTTTLKASKSAQNPLESARVSPLAALLIPEKARKPLHLHHTPHEDRTVSRNRHPSDRRTHPLTENFFTKPNKPLILGSRAPRSAPSVARRSPPSRSFAPASLSRMASETFTLPPIARPPPAFARKAWTVFRARFAAPIPLDEQTGRPANCRAAAARNSGDGAPRERARALDTNKNGRRRRRRRGQASSEADYTRALYADSSISGAARRRPVSFSGRSATCE